MDNFHIYDTARYTGPFDRQLFLPTGETGTIVEDYGDGHVEVEFSFPDGTTWLQCALSLSRLRPDHPDATLPDVLPSRDVIFPAILAFEAGQQGPFIYPPTQEPLLISRARDGRIAVATQLLGTILAVVRPALPKA
ncbi:MAG: DUF4926 domain-containing protein [Rhodobacteraceae bacterium]|nr:DUF4926 domain-containing protein [Paracoccaceae bacterium]